MMFRQFYIVLLLVCGLLLWCVPAVAQGEEPEAAEELVSSAKGRKKKAKKGGAQEARGEVARALGNFEVYNGKVNLKADYYIFLYSASLCRYCRECMPIAVDEYKKIKRSKKVELVLICGDKTEGAAKNYVRAYKGKMPYLMIAELKATNFQGLPGCGMPGFPAVSVADKDGTLIKSVVGAVEVQEVLSNWKDYTISRKKK